MRINRQLLLNKILDEYKKVADSLPIYVREWLINSIWEVFDEKSINLNRIFELSRFMSTTCRANGCEVSA